MPGQTTRGWGKALAATSLTLLAVMNCTREFSACDGPACDSTPGIDASAESSGGGTGGAGGTGAPAPGGSGAASGNAGAGSPDSGGQGAAPHEEADGSVADAGPPVTADGDVPCPTDYGDCVDAVNGCETKLTTDVAHCGTCDHACSSERAATQMCVAGTCKPTCSVGFADCSTPAAPESDDGCETDLTSPTDCGRCGRDCLGGACVDGECQVATLIDDLSQPSGAIAATADFVYFSENGTGGGTLWRLPAAGGTDPTPLATGLGPIIDLDIADGTLFMSHGVTDNGVISKVTLPDGPVTPLWFTSESVRGHIAVDDTHVYCLNFDGARAIWRVPRTGGTPTQAAPAGGSGSDIEVGDTYLWFLQGSDLHRIRKVGWADDAGAAGPVLSNVREIELDGARIFAGDQTVRASDQETLDFQLFYDNPGLMTEMVVSDGRLIMYHSEGLGLIGTDGASFRSLIEDNYFMGADMAVGGDAVFMLDVEAMIFPGRVRVLRL